MHLAIKGFLALVFGVGSAVCWAQQTVNVVWPFSPASNQAAMVRNLVDEANKQQQKYRFVFLNKPGAGGAVAALTVANDPELSILFSGSSFYIRPLLYKDSHNVDQFSVVTEICSNAPIGIVSKRYKNTKDMLGREVSIGVNPGSITSLVSRTLAKNNPQITFREIPYKGTPEATTDMLGGHVDSSVDFLNPMNMARLTSDVSVVGITGQRNVGGFTTFESQGFKGTENLVNTYWVFVKASTPESVQREIHGIFNASVNQAVRQRCEEDFGQINLLSWGQGAQRHNRNKQTWNQLTQGLRID